MAQPTETQAGISSHLPSPTPHPGPADTQFLLEYLDSAPRGSLSASSLWAVLFKEGSPAHTTMPSM